MTASSTAPVQAPEATEPFFGIQRVFLKGASLEIPMGANLFLETSPPKLNLNLQVHNEVLADNVFQCSIRATLSSEANDKTLFLLEVEQAGVFEARNLTKEQVADIQEISAPTILAPYLRAQLADLLTRATLPAFYMPEINWGLMAQQNREAVLVAAQQATVPPVLH